MGDNYSSDIKLPVAGVNGGDPETSDSLRGRDAGKASDARNVGVLLDGRRSLCTRRSETNEAEDPESRRALATVTEPSGACTWTRHVMSSKLGWRPIVAWFDTDVVGEVSGGEWITEQYAPIILMLECTVRHVHHVTICSSMYTVMQNFVHS